MSARIPPGFAEMWVQFSITTDPEPMYVSIGIDLATGVGADQPTTDAMLTTAQTQLAPAVSSDMSIGPGHIIWGQDGGDVRIDGGQTPIAGTAASNMCPNNCAVLVRKLTASGGRRGRGRMYVPGIPEANVAAAGTINATFLASLVTAYNNLRLQLEARADIDQLVLLHGTAPFAPTPVTSLEVQPKIATQRRRMRP